jgi:hypothetical protein
MPIIRPGPSSAPSSERRYVDASGVAWFVREKATLGRSPALYFESRGAFRRVTHYPPDWRDLTTGELEILSRQT